MGQYLEHRLDAAQRHRLLLASGSFVLIALVDVLFFQVGLFLLVIVGIVLSLQYFAAARFRTKITSSGIEVTVLRTRRIGWNRIVGVGERKLFDIRYPVLHLTDGHRVKVRAPVDGGLLPDDEYDDKLRRIREWHGRYGVPPQPPPQPRDPYQQPYGYPGHGYPPQGHAGPYGSPPPYQPPYQPPPHQPPPGGQRAGRPHRRRYRYR